MVKIGLSYYERRIKLHELENLCAEKRGEIESKMLDIYHGLWYDYLTELRYNHNHDSKGRFCSGGGSGSAQGSYHDPENAPIKITDEAINSVPEFTEFDTPEQNAAVREACKAVLQEVKESKLNTEALALIDISSNKFEVHKGEEGEGTVPAKSLDKPFISVHNHPSGGTFSVSDIERFYDSNNCKAIVVISNDGKSAYVMSKTLNYASYDFFPYIRKYFNETGCNNAKSYNEFLKGAEKYGVKYTSKSN